ncbi:MAG: family 10 glycosylhydrolase [Rhodothermia bacterium]
MRQTHFAAFLAIALLCAGIVLPGRSAAQSSEAPKYEFRGAWIATVLRLDWPPRSNPQVQQDQLILQLDSLKAAGINAVFFQIRPESDAMYNSDLEPWSYWLTGMQGRAPDPFFDPLQVAIDEAHKRGMELHAWFNPYRASRGSAYETSPDHVTKAHPEWILWFGSRATLDPGLPDVREHIIKVIVDVVNRYDIDGVHFDDYFYPYPPNHISNEDAQTFADHNRGFTDVGDWRRDNVNILVQQVSDTLTALKPALKFGIAPFGIWKNGVPPGIVGLDAYNVIYGDALAWLNAESIDYLVPLLSWPFGGRQDYGKLASWWADQMNGRHMYVGHGAYRADPKTLPPPGSLISADEIPNQIRFNRDHAGIKGSVFFRAKNLTVFHTKGLADSLKTDFFRYPALTPVMPWKDQTAPPAPQALTFEWTGPGELTLSWDAAAGKSATAAGRFAVYRVQADGPPDLDAASEKASNLIALTGETEVIDRPDVSEETYYYFVRSISANSIESDASNVIDIAGSAVSTENPILPAFKLSQNYPNPFSHTTVIEYRLDRQASVSLRVFDATGRLVKTLVQGRPMTVGIHTRPWDGTDDTGRPVPSGAYFYSLEISGRRFTRGMVVTR